MVGLCACVWRAGKAHGPGSFVSEQPPGQYLKGKAQGSPLSVHLHTRINASKCELYASEYG